MTEPTSEPTELREYWTTGPGAVDIRPDPRLSNLRPGWLDGDGWRDRLSALADEDVEWIERQWELASGAGWALDQSWLRMEMIR